MIEIETSQQSQITATVGGRNLGVWDTFSGGKVSAERTVRRPGGMGPLRSSAALPTFDDVTITRQWDLARDWDLARTIRNQVGRPPASIQRQPLDTNGAPWGKPVIYTGYLTGSDDGESDSDSSDPGMWELTFQIISVA